ncbi:uncharacterized protein LOC142549120 isoform X2 [Primulina tabacum]|uniref:uncharacterized protein LOC142549120 isoform X2 n=1 Tax=Primulina tabacum TaxID=48773 RepID=UPI003F5AC6D6
MDSVLNLSTPPLVILYGISTGGGTRAGLFRTPISGGVQSATSAHGLRRPALAVQNLMEQMHHRLEGYPFGSLVDFAADTIGWLVRFAIFLAVITKNIAMYFVCGFDKDENSLDSWVEWLVNARVTIFGDVCPLPKDQQVALFATFTCNIGLEFKLDAPLYVFFMFICEQARINGDFLKKKKEEKKNSKRKS